MTPREHARLARLLIRACGGLEEAAGACRVGKTSLSNYQNPHLGDFIPADVMADLEEHCGEPIYSRALFEARPEVAQARDTERDRLANVHAEAERQLRDVGDLIKREA